MSFPLTTEKADPFSRNGWLEIPFFADNPIPKTVNMADRKYSEDEINIIRRVDEIAKRRSGACAKFHWLGSASGPGLSARGSKSIASKYLRMLLIFGGNH